MALQEIELLNYRLNIAAEGKISCPTKLAQLQLEIDKVKLAASRSTGSPLPALFDCGRSALASAAATTAAAAAVAQAANLKSTGEYKANGDRLEMWKPRKEDWSPLEIDRDEGTEVSCE